VSWAVPQGSVALSPKGAAPGSACGFRITALEHCRAAEGAYEGCGRRVIIWDRGTWEARGVASRRRAERVLPNGKLRFRACTVRSSRGRWHLVRNQGRSSKREQLVVVQGPADGRGWGAEEDPATHRRGLWSRQCPKRTDRCRRRNAGWDSSTSSFAYQERLEIPPSSNTRWSASFRAPGSTKEAERELAELKQAVCPPAVCRSGQPTNRRRTIDRDWPGLCGKPRPTATALAGTTVPGYRRDAARSASILVLQTASSCSWRSFAGLRPNVQPPPECSAHHRSGARGWRNEGAHGRDHRGPGPNPVAKNACGRPTRRQQSPAPGANDDRGHPPRGARRQLLETTRASSLRVMPTLHGGTGLNDERVGPADRGSTA